MNEDFLINIDQLRKSGNLSLNMSVSSDFLNMEEGEVHFGPTVELQGEAYVVDDKLVLHIDLLATAILVCTICNGDAPKTVKVENFYHVEEISNIKSHIFDISPVLRQEILLEVPAYYECRDGNCPEREFIKNYLGPKKSS